jgi:hypothetical protein
MLGLLCSTIAKRTLRATIMTYLIIIGIVVGAYFYVLLRTASVQPGMPVTSRSLAVSPFSAMTSIVMRGATPGAAPGFAGGIAMDMARPMMMFDANMLMNMPPFNNFTYGLVDYNNPNGPVVQPVYRYAFVAYPLFSIVCYWLASHFVRPRRRWRIGLHDLLMFLLVVSFGLAGAYWLNLWPWTRVLG